MNTTADRHKLGSFDRFVATHEQGSLNHDLTEMVRKAIESVENYYQEHRGTPKAKVTLAVIIQKDGDHLTVHCTADCKTPPEPREKRIYFSTEDNCLTSQNPSKPDMFATREVGSEPATVKTV
jgi:hypothetical protein